VLNLSLLFYFYFLPPPLVLPRWIDETRTNRSPRSTSPEAAHSLTQWASCQGRWYGASGSAKPPIQFKARVRYATALTAVEVRQIPCAMRGRSGKQVVRHKTLLFLKKTFISCNLGRTKMTDRAIIAKDEKRRVDVPRDLMPSNGSCDKQFDYGKSSFEGVFCP